MYAWRVYTHIGHRPFPRCRMQSVQSVEAVASVAVTAATAVVGVNVCSDWSCHRWCLRHEGHVSYGLVLQISNGKVDSRTTTCVSSVPSTLCMASQDVSKQDTHLSG